MKARALVRGISGKSLLAFAGIVLLLGVVTGEAAAVTVSGQVTKANVVVPNLFVVATTPAPNFTFLAQAQTNASGNYTIALPNMPVGTNFLVFVDLTGTRLVSDLSDTIEKTLTIPLDGSNITGVNFKLVDGVKLSGIVTNTTTSPSSPASGVIVFATNPSLGFKFLGQVTTGADGTYGLLVPPSETAELAVDTQGKFPGTVVDPVFRDVVVSTLDISGLNFSLIPGVIVQGRVTDVLGHFISNALVEAFSSDGLTWLADHTTGLDGTYSVAVALKWGQILLRVTAAGFVERRLTVTLVSPTTTQDVVLSTSVQISGHVTDASTKKPVANVPVEADFGAQILDVGATDLNGFYTLDVPPNQGLVTIHADTTSLNYLQPPDQQVNVITADFIGIDFQLTPSVNISGTVTNADSNPPGAAIGGAGVTAFQGAITLAFALTNASGFYTLKVAVNQGTVDIHVDAGKSFQTADQLVTVGTSDIPNVNFALKQAVQKETVTITRADWAKNLLTVFATDSLQPNATLKVTVADKSGKIVVNNATMTFSTTRSQYEFRLKTTTNLNGGKVTVTSNSGVSAGPVTIPFP